MKRVKLCAGLLFLASVFIGIPAYLAVEVDAPWWHGPCGVGALFALVGVGTMAVAIAWNWVEDGIR